MEMTSVGLVRCSLFVFIWLMPICRDTERTSQNGVRTSLAVRAEQAEPIVESLKNSVGGPHRANSDMSAYV